MGFRLNDNGIYDAIEHLQHGGLHSDVLSIDFKIQEDGIGLLDTTSSEWLQTPEEKAINARKQAEEEAARLRIEIEKLKAIQEKYEN